MRPRRRRTTARRWLRTRRSRVDGTWTSPTQINRGNRWANTALFGSCGVQAASIPIWVSTCTTSYSSCNNSTGILCARSTTSTTTPPPTPDLGSQHPPTTTHATRTRPRPSQTSIMQHTIIRQHSDHAAPEAFVTDSTDPLLPDNDPPIPPSLAPWNSVTQQKHRLARHQLRLPQPRHDPRLVDDAVGAAHAAAEVRLELGHLQGVGDEG